MTGSVYVAQLTPYRQRRSSVDPAAAVDHAAWLRANGVAGLVPFGSYGEGPSLAVDEKVDLLTALCDADLGLALLPALTEGNLGAATALLRRMAGLPLRGVLVLPPTFYPSSDAGSLSFYWAILDVTSFDVFAYHVPKYAPAVPLSVVAALPLAGVKDSGDDAAYGRAVAATGKVVLAGSEGEVLDRREMRADALVSALGNVVPETVVRMVGLLTNGNKAEAEPDVLDLVRLRADVQRAGGISALKRLVGIRRGRDLGGVRPPLPPLDERVDLVGVLAQRGIPSAAGFP